MTPAGCSRPGRRPVASQRRWRAPQAAARIRNDSVTRRSAAAVLFFGSWLRLWLGRTATGSPQPPPGGGLLLCVAGPSARLRAGLVQQESVRQDRAGRSFAPRRSARPARPLGCGLALQQNRSVRTVRAAVSPREGPLLASARPLVQARPLGCGLALQQESVRQDRAGRSFAPRRPAARVCKSARACPSQAAARFKMLNFES